MQLKDWNNIFFVGIAGAGMSALAQYMAGEHKNISGSDRYFNEGKAADIKEKLEACNINCYLQGEGGITSSTDLVVVSTAIEDTVPEVKLAQSLNIPIIKRAEMLALICKQKRTIAIGGTSGKSTTSAMLFDVLAYAGFNPGIISGAGLVSLIKKGLIGNAANGGGEWLIIEADESDGSIVQYEPEIGVLLNIDKDHQEVDVLMDIFDLFKRHSQKHFIVNQSNPFSAKLSTDVNYDFSTNNEITAGYTASDFEQNGLQIHFKINGIPFNLNTLGAHNMENATAAVAVAAQLGISLQDCAAALAGYKGIYRRHQIIGEKNGIWLIDDYAHNPVKCAASIRACQAVAPKVIAWLQPHGYGPTRFLRHDFVAEIAAALRPEDEIWMSEIFYAGGTATKDISANDLIKDLQQVGVNAFFVEDRSQLLNKMRPHLVAPSVLLLMGARDPSLEFFAQQIWNKL